MRVLVVTPHYLPDGGPSAPLFAMLCESLVRRGHKVTVVAAVPHYPSGEVPAEYRGWRTRRGVENGVQVVRVPVPSVDRSQLLHRLFQFVVFQFGASRFAWSEACDVVLLSNPALSTGLPLAVASVLRRRPVVYSVHDVYPTVGVALGVFRHRAVIGVVGALERFSLGRARRVRILAESFLPGIRALGVPSEKVELIYDWVDTQLVRPLPRANGFAQEHGLTDTFVVLYAGNLGLSQGLEHVLTVAERLALHTGICFVFVGDGPGRARLLRDAERRRLTNVRFFPFQPRSRLPEVLATADVSLVPLQSGIGAQSLPSKSLSILASERPVIASVDQDSDLARLLQRAEAGLCVPPEDPERLAEAVMTLQRDPELRARLGRNGRAYAETHHSPDAAAEHFERLLALASGEVVTERR